MTTRARMYRLAPALGLGLLLAGLLLIAVLFVPSAANVEQMQGSTVRILCKTQDRVSLGSGFVVAADPVTYIVTSNHVAACARAGEQQSLAVVLSRTQTVPLQIEWHDADKDLALVRTAETLGRPAARLADTTSVMPGAPVTVIGFPGAADDVVDTPNIAVPSVSRGNLSRIVPALNGTRYFQHTAPTNPGNSGGPVYDEAGNVIGVNSLKPLTLVPTISGGHLNAGRIATGEGIALAVDAAEVVPHLEKLQVPFTMTGTLSTIDLATTLVAAAIGLMLAAAGIVVLTPSGREWLFRRAAPAADSHASKPQVGRIRVLDGALAGTEMAVSAKVVLGRDPVQAQLVFPGEDTAVSRRHCEISFNRMAAQFEVRDLKSRNGTFIANDAGPPRRLTPDLVECVPPGQKILVGSTRNRLVLELG